MAEYTDPAPDTVDREERYTDAEVDARINAAATPANLIRAGEAIDWMRAQRDEARAQVATLTAERDAAVASLLELQPLAPVARLTAELAERTRERDLDRAAVVELATELADERTMHQQTIRERDEWQEGAVWWEREQAKAANQVGAMRPVVEPAIAHITGDADRSTWRALAEAVERYQHPAVAVSPDATDPDCGCPTGAGHTCGRLDDDRCTCAWNNGYLREPPRIGHRPGCPAGTPQQPETVVQPNTGAQGPDAVQDRTRVPEAAIGAAARATYELDPQVDPGGCEGSPPMTWRELPLTMQAQYREEAEVAVRAAAPHIQREALLHAAKGILADAADVEQCDAWDRGYAAGLERAAHTIAPDPAGSQDETGGGE